MENTLNEAAPKKPSPLGSLTIPKACCTVRCSWVVGTYLGCSSLLLVVVLASGHPAAGPRTDLKTSARRFQALDQQILSAGSSF